MFLMFQSIFLWAKPLMDRIDGVQRGRRRRASNRRWPPGPLRSLLVDGVIKGVGGVLVFLPQILILFVFIAVLEDCGYMARAAFLMDRLMSRCGLSGKSFIPLLSSVACAVPGDHGDAGDREPPRPAGDDPRRPADELLGPAAGVHAADRGVPAKTVIPRGCRGWCCSAMYMIGFTSPRSWRCC